MIKALRLATLSLAFFALAIATQAQQQPAQAPAAPPAAQSQQKVDETALRYFARQGDQKRVDAEIARLKALYPGWEPPANLLANDYVPDPDIEKIWDLYGKGEYAAARAAIATKQAADPAFTPSADLLHSLDVGEAGMRLRNASDASQYETVVSIAANTPELLTCESVDSLWRVAEALIKTERTSRGLDAYKYVLTNCTDPQIRLATMQKAMALLDRTQLDTLFALERAGTDGAGEFASIRLSLARNALADVLTGKSSSAGEEDVKLLDSSARQTKAPDDLRLLGWYALNQKRPADAQQWFEMATAADPGQLSAHGLAVALLDQKQPGQAEAILTDYRTASPELTTLYLTAAASLLSQEPRPQLEAAVLNRVVAATMEARNANTAQELGWYAYAFSQPQTAAQWFRLATTWDPQDEPSAYGLLVTSDALKDAETVRAIKSQWSARSARIASFGQRGEVAPTPAPVAPARNPEPAATMAVVQPQPTPNTGGGTGSGSRSCSTYVPPASLSPAGALARAWCLMDLNRPSDAVANFARALNSSSEKTRSDAAYGQSLAYIRLGLPSDAMVASSSAPLSQARINELQVAIHTRAALAAYEIGDYRNALRALDERSRYAPEQNDLLVLRAWSYYHLRRYREADQIFTAVAATGFQDAIAGQAAARDALRIQASREP